VAVVALMLLIVDYRGDRQAVTLGKTALQLHPLELPGALLMQHLLTMDGVIQEE
jgi:hypothetical protein